MRTGHKLIPAGAALLTTIGLNGMLWSSVTQADTGATQASVVTPKVTMSQAEKIAKSTFSIPSSYTLQNESYNGNTNGDQPSTYNLNFNQSDKSKPSGNINVTVDANNGQIVGYNGSQPQGNFVFPEPTSADQAKQDALTWVKKLYPNEVSQVQALPLQPQGGSLNGAVSYTYNFERMAGGIPAPFDGFSITIGEDGSLNSVQNHWTTLSFPSQTPAISSAQANMTYQSSLDLHLSYSQIWNNKSEPKTELTYIQNQSNNPGYWQSQFNNTQIDQPVIAAGSGTIIDSMGAPMKTIRYQSPKPLVPGGPVRALTPKALTMGETHAP